jgi:acyl-CoA synthetase (AMP-forming)/AMP-acid ligase II
MTSANQHGEVLVSLLSWLTHPPADRGLHLADLGGDGWHFFSYERLAELAYRAAGAFQAAGVRPGDVVTIVRPASAEFVADFFGALLAGATPSPVAPPTVFRDRSLYAQHLARVAELVAPRVVTTTADVAPLLTAVAGRVLVEPPERGPRYEPAPPPDIGLVQFSSGSTGMPRGVRIPLTALQANVSAIHRWLRVTPADAHASWLPLHHDMGLVGQLLVPIENAADFWLMRPEQFIRSPARWVRAFDAGGATGTAVPTFSLAHIVSRVKPRDLDGLDLSGWRFSVVGAERIDHAVVRAFLDLLGPYGLREDVLVPAYGLAESTLAVSGAPVGTPVTTVTVDSRSLVVGTQVSIVNSGTTLVGCGSALSGISVRVVDDDGRQLPAGHLGELEIAGDSLARGYVGEAPYDGPLRTGDAGFVHDGHLYVVGRLGDSVKQLGRWFFAEDAEQRAATVSPRPRDTIALVGVLAGRETAVVLVEGQLEDAAEKVGRAVAEGADTLRVVVRSVPVGTIQRTTSGKPRRKAMWQHVVTGTLGGSVAWDSDEGAGA